MKIVKGLMAAAMLTVAMTSGARVIEHTGDRYLINVNEMELDGEESLLDVLMMCPEVLSRDGHTTASPSLLGSYVVRINNININMDTEMFLKNTKAREVKQIKMCVNPGIMKGTGGINKVIDLTFRKDEKGTYGKVALEGDPEASGEVFGRVTNQSGKAWIMSQVAGKLGYSDNVHSTHEAANVNVDWNITSKDNLKMQAAQYYTRSRPGRQCRSIRPQGDGFRQLHPFARSKRCLCQREGGGRLYHGRQDGIRCLLAQHFALRTRRVRLPVHT